MYRTYKNLFRVKPEISSIGTGPKRYRLPQDMVINLDMVFVFFVSLPVFRFTVALLFGFILRTSSGLFLWTYAIMLAAALAYMSRKFEPSGKSIMQYVVDIMGFMLRSRWHDGWEKTRVRLYRGPVNFQAHAYLLENESCGSLPATGAPDTFELKVPAAIRVRGRRVEIQKHGKRYAPGEYQMANGKVIPIRVDKGPEEARKPKSQPPKIRRKRKEGTENDADQSDGRQQDL